MQNHSITEIDIEKIIRSRAGKKAKYLCPHAPQRLGFPPAGRPVAPGRSVRIFPY